MWQAHGDIKKARTFNEDSDGRDDGNYKDGQTACSFAVVRNENKLKQIKNECIRFIC